MAEVINTASEMSPQWLSGVLRREGSLNQGHVVGIKLSESRTLLVSTISHLEIEYSDDATTDAPSRLFLKVSNQSLMPQSGRGEQPNELEFYNSIARLMPDLPVPRCYDAAFSDETGDSHLLLEDLSETHHAPPLPSFHECERAIDCLAELHAFWWEHPCLGRTVGRTLSDEEISGIAQLTASNYIKFANALGDRLSNEWRRIYESVIGTFPRPWVRLSNTKGLTLTHGDAHMGNFLFPRQAGRGRVYLIDWQLWHVHKGPRDLAFMITLYWEPETRLRMERALLKRYYEGLLRRGVKGYEWKDCWKDYRWSAVRNIFIPILQWSRGRPESLWRPQMQRALSAFEDLHCAELINR